MGGIARANAREAVVDGLGALLRTAGLAFAGWLAVGLAGSVPALLLLALIAAVAIARRRLDAVAGVGMAAYLVGAVLALAAPIA
jgi:hypothetical protein